MSSSRRTHALHLVRRFAGALRPGGPDPAEVEWVTTVLRPAEVDLWSQMPGHDRRHSLAVARRVERTLAGGPYASDPRWLAAALLHDVGKLEAALCVPGRVGATLVAAPAGHARARSWSTRAGVRRRVGLYLCHPELGARRIRACGGHEEAAQWAGAHHHPDQWPDLGIPPPVVEALHEADDD
jgi:hypothetical protein